MPRVQCSFEIVSPTKFREPGPDYAGVCLPQPADVQEIAQMIGGECVHYGEAACLRVDLEDTDPRLSAVIEHISSHFGWKPQTSKVIPQFQASSVYGMNRLRTWTESEIERAPFLRLVVNSGIGKHYDGDDQQCAEEVPCLRDASRTVQLGVIAPYHCVCLSGELLGVLKERNLLGLSAVPASVQGDNPRMIYGLRSEVIMPPALNPVVNEAGLHIEPNTQWWSFHDDGGVAPEILRFDGAKVRALGDFAIAMTFERVGFKASAAYRWCIVNQSFRTALKAIGIRNVKYVPVALVES